MRCGRATLTTATRWQRRRAHKHSRTVEAELSTSAGERPTIGCRSYWRDASPFHVKQMRAPEEAARCQRLPGRSRRQRALLAAVLNPVDRVGDQRNVPREPASADSAGVPRETARPGHCTARHDHSDRHCHCDRSLGTGRSFTWVGLPRIVMTEFPNARGADSLRLRLGRDGGMTRSARMSARSPGISQARVPCRSRTESRTSALPFRALTFHVKRTGDTCGVLHGCWRGKRFHHGRIRSRRVDAALAAGSDPLRVGVSTRLSRPSTVALHRCASSDESPSE
jgi:hypothetical protein